MKNKIEFTTDKFKVGDDNPTYFIADIAANHDGNLERAKELIYKCAEAGANAAKFQNFFAETIVSDAGFRELGVKQSHQSNWEKPVFEVYNDASVPLEWTKELRDTCDDAGVDYFTSPYDIDSIPLLSKYVAAWKLGSGDITWHEIISAMASQEKPFFVATGASSMDEVRAAVEVASSYTDKLCLMQCNTNYTGSIENFNYIELNVLQTYSKLFPEVVLGLSDHTPGCVTVLGAVSLGAKAIEKHFTDDTSRKGPDHLFSMDPSSWSEMVDRTRELEMALGTGKKRIMENESETIVLQRRAIRTNKDLPIGHKISREDISLLRPCPVTALPPYEVNNVVGKRLKNDFKKNHLLRLEDLCE